MSHIGFTTKFNFNDKNLPPKENISKEWFTDPPQRYSGDALNNNIHGNGFYFIQKDKKIFYDGLFYANKLEGYSHIFYGDSSHFQGLFKDHKRLGPGVLTYQNGEQDVGLWEGFSLVRLETVVEPNVIPMLGNSVAGKVKLVKYRYLVPVCPNDDDIATEALKGLDANDRILDDSNKLYNLEVENKNNVFFYKLLFDEKFYAKRDCLIDILIPENEENEEDTELKYLERNDEEECIKGSSTDSGRVRQISDELDLLEYKLNAIRKVKGIVAKRVQYCKVCCYGMQEEECVSPFEEDVSQQADTDYSGYQSTDYEKDVTALYERDTDSLKRDSLFKIEDYLLDNCDCLEARDIDDLDNLEKQLEDIRNDELFYETIKENLQIKLKYHLKKCESCQDVKTKQVLVNDLLAWNNEELSMCMLKHSFLHRRSEYMVMFNICDLLKGNRDKFSASGVHERNCIEFLLNCTNGSVKNLLRTIRMNNINVNMCDVRGNSGIFFAVANGKFEVIQVLVNFGANLDQINDEGLTPLLVCLLIYLAIHYERFDWENSFLPEFQPSPESQKDLPKWCQTKSHSSLNNDNQSIRIQSQETVVLLPACDNRLLKMRIQKTHSQLAIKESYLFDTTFKDYKEPKKKGKAKPKKADKNKPVEEAEAPSPEIQLMEEGKEITMNTICRLLEYGANPNIGEVPLPPLLIAIFSENSNIVKSILVAKANIDVAMTQNMTSLHVIVSLRCAEENIEICRTLLEYGADANLRTSTDHWSERKPVLLGKNVKPDAYEDLGKNPLHILCLRKDFPTDACNYFSSIALMLLKHDINPHDMYLGHTALSIAVLMGNLNLVETILNSKPLLLNPHLVLGYNMGNVLTLYILKRYNNILPLERCMQMLKLLVDMNVNLLRSVGEFENAIEFMDKEHEVIKVDKKKSKKKDKSSKGSKKSDKSSKKSKKGKKGKTPPQEVLKDYMKELARDTIVKYIQLEAVQHLYNLAEAQMLDFTFTKILAEFLTPTITLDILEALFKNGRIKSTRFNKDFCLKVVEFVEKYQKVVKAKKGKKEKKKKGKKDKKGKGKDKKSKSSSSKSSTSQETLTVPPPPTYSEIIDATNYDRLHRDKSKIKLKRPGLDETSKYIVCFHCLKRANKLLLVCPRCQYIYYCSEQCNKLNVKMKAQHSCKMNFYKVQKQRLESGTLGFEENIHEICKIASETCEELLIRKQEEEKEMQRKLLEEENRLDIYGTRFIKNKQPIKKRISLRSYVTSAATSVATSLCLPEKMGIAVTPLEQKLTRISYTRDEKYIDMMNKKHESSLKAFSDLNVKKVIAKGKVKKKSSCICMDETLRENEKKSVIPVVPEEKNIESRKTVKASAVSKIEATKVITEPEQIIRKLRKIPSKYQYFIELLSNCFPDVDLSFLFLPYACYCNGQLYYKFLDENVFSKTYSMV